MRLWPNYALERSVKAFERARRRRADHYRACGALAGLPRGRSTRTLDGTMTLAPSALVFALIGVAAMASDQADIAAAAKKYYPAAAWQSSSILIGDFSCHGQREAAILGIASTAIVVAVFLDGVNVAPQILEYSTSTRNPSSAVLTTESLDFTLAEMKSDIGYIPEGMRPSKTCLGLNMSDREVDSAHIYWNHNARRFTDWVR